MAERAGSRGAFFLIGLPYGLLAAVGWAGDRNEGGGGGPDADHLPFRLSPIRRRGAAFHGPARGVRLDDGFDGESEDGGAWTRRGTMSIESAFQKRVRSCAAAGLVCVLPAGCAVNPVTGRRQLALVSEAQEIQMGQQAAQQVSQQLGLVDNQALQEYVQRVGAQLAAESERPNLPWTFRVVDDPTPNAFALPGGFIFMTRGMMDLMDSEAELAAVLGHEIGHVTARHSVTQISRGQLAQLGLGLGSVLFPSAAQSFGGLAQTGMQLLFLSHSRGAERQADELGFRYALNEGFEVREMDDI